MNVKALVKWNCSQVCLVHYSGDLVACNPTEKTFESLSSSDANSLAKLLFISIKEIQMVRRKI